MKTIKLVSLLTLTLLLAQGCVPDDGPIDPKPIVKVDETDEDAADPIDNDTPDEDTSSTASNTITDNIIITGSAKIMGVPPTPNGAISLDLSSVTKTGLPEEGFDIDFSSEVDVVGAYIQFKATDAAISDSYFDVDLLKNAEAPDTDSKSKRRMSAKMPSDNAINIDFTPQLQTGNFCYVICVYDQAGNISAPQEVCVTVNSWGGNPDLIGTWNLTRNEEIFDGEIDTETVGIEDCDEPIGTDSTDTRCYLIEYWTLIFNNDSTFEFTIKEFNRDTADEPDFVDFDIETIKGNWSYDPVTGELIIAIYYYQYEENGVVLDTEIDAIGDADISRVQRMEIGVTTLNLIWDELDNSGDGNIDESYIEYYEKQ